MQIRWSGNQEEPHAAGVETLSAVAARSLHYVWINKDGPSASAGDNEEAFLSSVPLHYFDRAFENAARYPDAKTTIWIDRQRLDPMTSFWVDSHAYVNAPSNVVFRPLADVPAYRDGGDIYTNPQIAFWDKVDLARFQVLSHSLTEQGSGGVVYYADFDVRDVQLDNPRTLDILERRGYAFARLPHEAVLSHGYMAFGAQGRDFLDGTLLPAFETALKRGGHIFPALMRSFSTLDSMFWSRRIATDVPVPPQKLKMLRADVYVDERICGYEYP